METSWLGRRDGIMYIETPRMIIREFAQDDAADLHDIFGDDETMENCEPAFDFDKTQKFLTDFCIDRNGAVAAVHRESGKVIGYILFNGFERGVYEMGWIYNRSYWRKGYAFEACKAVIVYAFTVLNAHKIFAEAIDTVKSVGLMKKLGMQLEGIQRSHTRDAQGNWTDVHLYGLLKDDWRKQVNTVKQ